MSGGLGGLGGPGPAGRRPADGPVDSVAAALSAVRILPVIVLGDAADARPLGGALAAGGLRLAEITLRTPAALDGIRAMAADPDMIVGAGTVTDPDQVDAAVAAGARFIVSPGFDARVVRRARQLEVAVYPGIATPTELQAALAEGVDVVKFFPAEPLGGLPMVAALAGPFGGVRFIPTGGIGAARVRDYLAHPAVLAVGGSWMAPAAAIAAGDWARITALTGESVASARG